MQKHTKIYMNYFDYTIADFIYCEIPRCFRKAVDINHIDCRGMGGDPTGSKDKIENLMAMCRECHNEYGDKKAHKEFLKSTHLEFMKHGK